MTWYVVVVRERPRQHWVVLGRPTTGKKVADGFAFLAQARHAHVKVRRITKDDARRIYDKED